MGTYSLHHYPRDLIRIRITRRSPILKIALPLRRTRSRHPHARATVRYSPGKGIDVGRLVLARHAVAVALAVNLDVLDVALLKLLHRGLDVLHAAVGAHFGGRDVRVQACAVPVAFYGFGLEGDDDAEFFGDAVEEKACHPELVAHWQV